MRKISRPFVRADDPDRQIRCQDALQFAFRDLVAAATSSGWREQEVLAALIELADQQMLTTTANDDAEALIAILKRMK